MKLKIFYDEALDFVSREAQENVIDAIVCTFHNEGYSLQGNTAESDVDWFANLLYERHRHFGQRFYDLPEEDQKIWRERANDAIELLPRLMERIADRMVRISQALRTIQKEQKVLKTKK